jgi:secreted trypsin-like serine protease
MGFLVSRRAFRVTAALAGALTLALSASVPAFAVADGTPAQKGQYRFAVKLTMTDIPRPDGSVYNSGCSGALVAPQWVLTAGHCFHDVNRNPVSGPVPYDTRATIGRVDDADTNGRVVAVEADYQAPGTDIALAKLSKPVYGITPLLPTAAAPTEGEVLRIAGWGALGDVNATPATHLQTGQVKVSTVGEKTVGVVGYRPEPTTSACLYDSGAPYFAEPEHGRPKLVSVESNGPSCPHADAETTSRVDTIIPWLKTTMRENRG